MIKKSTIREIILKLLAHKLEIGLQDVAVSARMSNSNESERKAISRAFKELVEQGIIQPKGQARARVYHLTKHKSETREVELGLAGISFRGIPLSTEAENLLLYISKPLQGRTPVGYNQNFLKSYLPNRTYYLSPPQQQELLKVGNVENLPREAGTYARNIFNRLLIDLSWNSSRLEGNTYSLLETKRLIELGENAAGKDASEAQMILNHKGAIEYIIESANETRVSSHEVYSIHSILSENLLGDPAASGRIRKIAVAVSGTCYLPLENPDVLKDCFEIFIEKLNLIENPFEQSFFSLVHLSYLQAFEDVNKRTSRLVANIPMIKKNLKPLSFIDVDKDAYVQALLGIYEKTDVSILRDLYIWAYKRSAHRYTAVQQAMGEPNLLKLKYRSEIQEMIRSVILNKIKGPYVVSNIQQSIHALNLPEQTAIQLRQIIEVEIMSLHDGNIARFKVRPSEFQVWKSLQS